MDPHPIKTVSYFSRVMIVHIYLKWTSTYNFDFCSFARFMPPTYIFKHLPGHDNLSPEEKWMGFISPSFHHVYRVKLSDWPASIITPAI